MSKSKKQHKQRNHNDVININEARKPSFPQRQRKSEVRIIPRNIAQEEYVENLYDYNKRFNFAVGPAGTGKTLLGVLRAIEMFKNGEVDKLVITRPAVSVDEKHGFLPGDLNAKMDPWVKPIMDVFEEYYSPEEIADLLEQNLLEIAPLGYMRGRTFKNAYIIADEMQNATPDQMKMLLTRLGEGAYMTVTGDLKQHDRGFDNNGLKDFLAKQGGNTSTNLGMAYFTKEHVERDPVVKQILDIYGEDE